ncbi:hypothetical protein LCGC14_1517310 [marine sediment metagenome]|uniref:Prohead serine protease domain-containing protein n=1 Tax=marine sediment metagenome TaxID=412755 RepID=A0A0F9M0T8_9ZZZZ
MLKKHFAKGLVRKIKENGIITGAVGSTGSTDRDGEVLDPKGWQLENFKNAPRLLWSHDARSLPIGKVMNVRVDKDGSLRFDAEFAEKENAFAHDVAKLVRGGFLNTFSVGFRGLEFDREEETFTKMELLEISLVNVPANPDARLSHEYKSFMDKEKKAFAKKKEVKIEEDEKSIKIPVNKCKITATIDISKKQGIRALFCGGEKKIATYIFLKAKGWTLAKAKKWVKDHRKNMVFVILKDELKLTLDEDKRIKIKNAIDICQEVLKTTEAPKGANKKIKVRSHKAQGNETLRALRLIDRVIEGAIIKIKKDNHEN